MNEITTTEPGISMQTLEHVLGTGDIGALSPRQRVELMVRTCDSLGLNPLTRPFRFLTLGNQVQMYATKDCTDQLRSLKKINLNVVDKRFEAEIYVVTVRAQTPDGRHDEDMGAVALGQARGDARANGLMKAITKAKRRVTLSICGLGLPSEDDIDSLPGIKLYDAEDEIPPPAPPPTARPSWSEFLSRLRISVESAPSADEIDQLLNSSQVTKARQANAPAAAKQELEAIITLGSERARAMRDDAAEASIPEDDADKPPA